MKKLTPKKIQKMIGSLYDVSCLSRRSLKAPMAKSIYIEPVNHCNLNCKYCFHSIGMTRSKSRMDFDLYRKIIKDINGKIESISLLAQGEPLLHSKIDDMVALAKDNGHLVNINSNGLLLTEKRLLRLIEAGLDSLYISFDCPSKALWLDYKSAKRPEWYDRVHSNVLSAIEIAKQYNKPFITLGVINFQRNFKYLQTYLDTFEPKLANIGNIVPQDLINMWGALDDDPSLGWYRNIKQLLQSGKISYSDFPVCFSPWLNFVVYADGRVNACTYDPNARMLVGDTNNSSILDIWNGRDMQRIRSLCRRRQYDEKYPESVICGTCNVMFDPYEQSNMSLPTHMKRLWYRYMHGITSGDLHNWSNFAYNFDRRRFELKKPNALIRNKRHNSFHLDVIG